MGSNTCDGDGCFTFSVLVAIAIMIFLLGNTVYEMQQDVRAIKEHFVPIEIVEQEETK